MRPREIMVWLGLRPNRGVGNRPYRFWHDHSWLPALLLAVAAAIIGGLVLLVFASLAAGCSKSDSTPSAEEINSSYRAGEKAGFEDCENHRYEGATQDPTGHIEEMYLSGYTGGYTSCIRSQRAYERGLKDGALDCGYFADDPNVPVGGPHNNSDASEDYESYERGYKEGNRPGACVPAYRGSSPIEPGFP